MADGTIDSLNIQIAADANSAEKSLESLAKTLAKLNESLLKNVSGLRAYSKGVGTITGAIRDLGRIKVKSPDFKGLNSVFRTLKDIDSDNAIKTADSLKKVADSMSLLGKANFNDSGISKTANSLKRLVSVDMGSIKTWNLNRTLKQIKEIGNVPDVSSSVNRLVSSLARFANAGDKIGQSGSGMANLGRQLKKTVGTFSGIKNISPEVNTFVSSMSKLANAGGKTGQTAAGLKNLAEEILKFFEAMKNAPKISENTIRMTQALAQLASSGGKVGIATNSVSSAFTKLSSTSTKTANVVKAVFSNLSTVVKKIFSSIQKIAKGISSAFKNIISAGGKALAGIKKISTGITSSIKNIGTSRTHLDKASSGFRNLLKTIIPLLSIRQLFSWGSEAIELGSSITEVENVVDTAFGNMADKAYEFAATAKEQFGLSELAAKQYAGTLMAMFNSSGVAQDKAAEMSTTLAGLAGDLASFYNIDTDTAFYKLRAGISGETEPLKQLGINMNIVNLEAYAMSQGITKSYQAMSLAEQSMLRYNYIMAVTKQTQGDFINTQHTWANQWRLLTLNVQQFSSVIGQGLIAALLPALQALNVLMAMLQKVAEAFRDFMYVLTGYEGEGSQGGFVNEFAGIGDVSTGLEDIGNSGGDAADGMDDAASAAEDLKKALSVLSFDELNQLSDAATDAGSAIGDLGGSSSGLDDINIPGTGIGDLGSITDALGKSKLPEAVNEWAERIRNAFLEHNWDKLGREIAWGVNKGLKKLYDVISWKKVGPKITAFTSAFTKSFNSLVKYIDWNLMGRALGAGINTLVNTFNQLVGPGGIDFKQIGEKLSIGLRGAIGEINWRNLGNALGNYFMYSWNILNGFISDMSRKDAAGLTGWEELGKSVAKALNGVFDRISFSEIASTLANGLNGAFTSLKNFALTFEWDELVDNIAGGITTFIEDFEWKGNALKLTTFLNKLVTALADLAADVPWEELGNKIGTFIGTAISNFKWEEVGRFLKEFVHGLRNALIGFSNGSQWKSLADNIASNISDFIKDTDWGAYAQKLTSFLNKLLDTLIPYVEDAPWEEIGDGIGDFIADALSTFDWDKLGEFLNKFITGLVDALSGFCTKDNFELLGDGIGDAISEIDWPTVLEDAVELIIDGIAGLLKGLWDSGDAGKIAAGLSSAFLMVRIADITGLSTLANLIISNFIKKLQTDENINKMTEAFKEIFSTSAGNASSETTEELGKVGESVEDVGEKASTAGGFLGTIKTILSGGGPISGTAGLIGAIDLFNKGQSDIQKIKDGTFDAINTINAAIMNAGDASGTSAWQMSVLQSQIAGFSYGTEGFQEAFDKIIGKLDDAGISSDDFKLALYQAMQQTGLTTGEYAEIIKKYIGNIGTSLDNAAEDSKSMETAVSSSTKSMKENVKSNLSDVNSTVDNAFGAVSDTTVLNWGNSAREVTLNLRAMKLAASEQLSAMTETVRSYSQSMYNIFTNKFEKLGERIAQIIDGMDTDVGSSLRRLFNSMQSTVSNSITRIAGQFSSLSRQISQNMQGLYNVGRNAAIEFANGISSVHIPMPHINVNASTWQNGNGYSYSMNSSVSWYKSGGLFLNPAIIGLAEAGREAVLPLENRKAMGMIADSITKSGNIGVDNETLKNAVAEGVAMAMMNNSMNQAPINVYAELRTESDEVLARAVTRGQQKIDYRMNPVGQF